MRTVPYFNKLILMLNENMLLRYFNRSLFLVLALLLLSCEAPDRKVEISRGSLLSLEQKMTYISGYEAMTALRYGHIEIDKDILYQAIEDGLKPDSKSLFSNDEITLNKRELDVLITQNIIEKNKQIGEANVKKAQGFLKAFRLRENVKSLGDGIKYIELEKGSTDTAVPHATEYYVDFTLRDVKGGILAKTEKDGGDRWLFELQKEGLKKILPLMSIGDRWEVIIPPDLAYGDTGDSQMIEPSSTLVYDIKVLNIK